MISNNIHNFPSFRFNFSLFRTDHKSTKPNEKSENLFDSIILIGHTPTKGENWRKNRLSSVKMKVNLACLHACNIDHNLRFALLKFNPIIYYHWFASRPNINGVRMGNVKYEIYIRFFVPIKIILFCPFSWLLNAIRIICSNKKKYGLMTWMVIMVQQSALAVSIV